MGKWADRQGSNLHNFLPQNAEWLNLQQVIFGHRGLDPNPFDRSPQSNSYLESAAFLFHMSATTLRIIRSLRAACSDPDQPVSGLPLQLTETDAPNTRVSLTPGRT
jgi:hypothetical protein